nr:odorant binding protein 15 [Aromia bungii]
MFAFVNMKTLCLVLIVITLGASKPVSDEKEKEVTELHEECSKTTGIGKEDYLKAIEEKEDSPKIKEHMLCFLGKMGIVSESGEIHKDVFKEQLTGYVEDEAKIEEIVAKCSKEEGSALETAYALATCVHQEKEKK